eukprot:CAMPEP_0201481676 /NCGR_PEP_ID=MMETSP0151_2-20130828/5941_1 /ASSEMBLY_ACC=CAM_ASM_000257 /TAXON_ID=200890 /ORGANISM="Paramoeba atlantica, Strain 621/1 / CCAP 1560/9" /LENGTH=376 /DNA_ID=CAMNT_0047863999 /DNA_START=221 /DNA_END=1351 /DNA_ORIENTATION=+
MGNSKSVVSLGVHDFTIERMLGKGAFGKVHVIVDTESKKFYALKILSKVQILRKGDKCVAGTIRERVILAKLSDPFIVNLWGAIQDNRNLYLILDMMIGGELNYYLNLKENRNGLDESTVKFYASNIILGLEYLHRQRYLHRDIKPGNLLLNEKGYASLTDFNVAIQLNENGRVTGYAGTRPYMAPEVLKREEYGPAIDLWSLGIVIFELLCGKLPWSQRLGKGTVKWVDEFDPGAFPTVTGEISDQMKKILRGKVTIPKSSKLSEDGRDFLKKILCLNRYTIPQCKSHAWFRDLSFEKLHKGEVEAPIIPRLDRASVDKNMALEEMMLEESHKKDKKTKLTKEEQEKFMEWDYICEEFQKEVDESGGTERPKKKK